MFEYRICRAYRFVTLRTAHHLVTWRVSAFGLVVAAMLAALITLPLLYCQQYVAAIVAIVFYRLLSALSVAVSIALEHDRARQQYLHPFMENMLMLSVLTGLILLAPAQLLWPALAVLIMTLLFDQERRLAKTILCDFDKTYGPGNVPEPYRWDQWLDRCAGNWGRTLLLMTGCYWSGVFIYAGFCFAAYCLVLMIVRLIISYRLLGARQKVSEDIRQKDFFDSSV